jgi:hypothetical protein
MAFYTFNQNNSGGVWDGPQYVIIEADSADEANMTAMDHGIYYDGVHHLNDCPCCGDRWYEVDDDDATDKPEIYGEDPAEHTNYLGQPADVKIVRKTVDK